MTEKDVCDILDVKTIDPSRVDDPDYWTAPFHFKNVSQPGRLFETGKLSFFLHHSMADEVPLSLMPNLTKEHWFRGYKNYNTPFALAFGHGTKGITRKEGWQLIAPEILHSCTLEDWLEPCKEQGKGWPTPLETALRNYLWGVPLHVLRAIDFHTQPYAQLSTGLTVTDVLITRLGNMLNKQGRIRTGRRIETRLEARVRRQLWVEAIKAIAHAMHPVIWQGKANGYTLFWERLVEAYKCGKMDMPETLTEQNKITQCNIMRPQKQKIGRLIM